MTLTFEIENYQWVCNCGKRGKFLVFGKACKASDRHIQEHERKLEWGFSTDLEKENK
jgi:hypothetical protein